MRRRHSIRRAGLISESAVEATGGLIINPANRAAVARVGFGEFCGAIRGTTNRTADATPTAAHEVFLRHLYWHGRPGRIPT